jgi:transcriptional regulator with XRE-family HTH domain
MTQGQLSAAVGVNLRTVGSWERGENVPRNRLAKLEEVLGVPLRDTSEVGPTSYHEASPAAVRAAGVDPEVLILLAEADPQAIEAVRAVLKAARRSD